MYKRQDINSVELRDTKKKKNKEPNESKDNTQAIKSLNIEISKLEKRLLRLNSKLDEANLKLADPDLYKDSSNDDLQDLIRNQLELSNEVELVDKEWMDMASKLDSLN